ncbi:hypothetical protein GPALN_012553 [Globodera pallida]|nr:hypothetical protein GPALN_012553 [Globodera pallida]
MARRYLIMVDSLKEQQSDAYNTETMSELLQGIASFTKTVQQTLNSYEVRKLGDKVQGYVMNFTETEQKVREATNEDPWGPTGPQMQEIASFTFQYDLFSEVMGMLWKRMFQENKLAWRRVYKSLVLLNYLIKNGSERVISTARDHVFEMRTLENYKCLDERGKDEGLNVRHRVKLILEMLNDEEILRTERRKAKTEGREKYQGFSKEDMLSGRGTSTKFDSFERWNEKKTTNTEKSIELSSGSRGGFNGGRREVTAFDFDSENRSYANGSPELGIREHTPESVNDRVVEDDEFGDFTSARVGGATPHLSVVEQTIRTPAPKPLSSPHSARVVVAAPPQQRPKSSAASSGGGFDLLGLGLDLGNAPAPFAPAHSAPSIVSNDDQNAILKTADVDNNNALLDDVFNSGSATKQNSGGNSLDFFSFAPTHQLPPSSIDNGLVDSIGGLVMGEHRSPNGQPSVQQQTMPIAEENLPKAAAVGSTWENLKGKVNIDFDRLCLKPSREKPTPSLNELKMSTSKESNSASSSSTAGNLLL